MLSRIQFPPHFPGARTDTNRMSSKPDCALYHHVIRVWASLPRKRAGTREVENARQNRYRTTSTLSVGAIRKIFHDITHPNVHQCSSLPFQRGRDAVHPIVYFLVVLSFIFSLQVFQDSAAIEGWRTKSLVGWSRGLSLVICLLF